MSIVFLILNLLSLALSIAILYYLAILRKENCECALTWKHTYLIAYVSFGVLMALGNLFGKNFKIPTKYLSNLSIGSISAIALISIAFVISYYAIALTYINELETKPCPCSVNTIRDVFKYVVIVQASLFGLALLMTGGSFLL